MELSLSHTLHLFNIFREYDGKDNCAQVLEEEIYKMFGTKYLNDEHDCNVVSMNSLNIYVRTPIPSHIDLAGNTSYHFAASSKVLPWVSPYHGPGPFAPFGSRI